MVGEGFASARMREHAIRACNLAPLPACGGSGSEVFFCPEEPVTREDRAVSLERLLRVAGYPPPGAGGIFADVPATYCLAGWIEQIYADQITAGCASSPLRYCPYSPVTRWQMAVFLSRVITLRTGEQAPTSGTINGQAFSCTPGGYSLFADVSPGDGGCRHVHFMYAKGITSGCATNPLRSCPGQIIPRQQMAVFLVRTHCIWDTAACQGL